MNSGHFRRMVFRNAQQGRETRAMLIDLLQDCPENMRHKPAGEVYDPKRSEVLAYIASKLLGHPDEMLAEAQRLFDLARQHKILRFDQETRSWNFARVRLPSCRL